VVTNAALAQGDECVELLMPLVHNSPGMFVLDTMVPPGHMQKEKLAGTPASALQIR
jgi:hypothetical protein